MKVKSEYNEMCLLEIGKGKYYEIVQKPIEITQRITALENDRYDYYRRCINEEKIKEIESLLPVLKEDLENARKDLLDLENLRIEIIDAYEQKQKDYKNHRKELKLIQNKINDNNKKIKFLISRIKYIEKLHNKGKAINPNKTNLKKTKMFSIKKN